ncbi:MAG: non-canonical purine NTP pyrophosphatase, RdgB/HAM1 family [Oceanospirillaceae bacterium]|nr:non-canonical purine NTP pyrophosphatase, RdgB/HAM1 family [Oceanospirillaceae bacterium]|tara:strand:- start:931 stop:1530 length:600 start_codon:yes stop_codon:yes gene_type:complete
MKMVLASGNAGKLRELTALFGQHLASEQIELMPQSQFQVPEAEETGLSFIENAIIKARHASSHTGLPALADDSGLEVDALKGLPGIYSARYAGIGAGDAANNAQLLEALKDVPEEDRTARFQCVLVYMRHASDPTPKIFQGTWEGRILREVDGDNGFGYDPLFYVPSEGCTAAAMTRERKNAVSHRGQAMRQLLAGWVS